MAAVIQSNRELKVIGLLGPWGSGKSSVVKFIRDRLAAVDKTEKFYCFTYDAWLHQSDPPRRAFLESLIRFLIESHVTEEPLWTDRLQKLNRQIEETDSTTTPTLSAAGRWLLPSALLVPFGMQLVGHDWFEALSKKDGSWVDHYAFFLGVLLTFLPFLVAGGLKLQWRPVRNPLTKEFWSKENWTTNRSPYETESILSIFTNREVQVQKNRTVRSPDPSTIEFQATFREIMTAVSQEGRRFIFVVDNLDRLPEAQAIEMWSTIRSFFLGHSSGVSLPTVILPIDENAVQRMYAKEHPDQKVATSLAQSFMDKTFNLTFRVTKPVLSNWQAYMRMQVKNLFADAMDPAWPYVVGSIYDRWLLSNREEPVTPRVINTLINSIGVLWLQWHGSEISFAAIAYYVIHRDRIDADVQAAVSGESFGVDDFDPDWQLSIAALHFGVDREQAAQILLEQQLRNAINAGAESEFAVLVNAPGFSHVFDRLLDAAVRDPALLPVNNAIRLYQSANLEEGTETNAAWKKLRILWARIDPQSDVGAEEPGVVRSLLSHCSGSALSTFLQQVSARLSRVQEAAFTKGEAIANFVEIARALYTGAQAANLTCPKITVAGDPRAYLKAIALCSQEPALVRCLASASAAPKVIESLAAAMIDPANAPAMEKSVEALLATDQKLQWDPVIEAGGTKLESGSDQTTVVSAKILGRLRRSQKAALTRIQQVTDSGNLLARFNEAYNANEIAASASFAALLLLTTNPATLVTPDSAPWDKVITTRPGFDKLLSDSLTAFGGVAPLQFHVKLGAANASLAPLARALASLQLKEGSLPLPPGDDAVARFKEYQVCFDPELWIGFVGRVSADESFWTRVESIDLAAAAPVLHAVLDAQSTARERGAASTSAKLGELDVAAWQPAIESGAEPLLLGDALRAFKQTTEIGGNLFEALRQSIQSFAKAQDEALRERWLGLADFLSTNSRKTLLRSVADYISRGDATAGLARLLSLRDALILKEGDFGRNSDGAATNIVLPLLAEGGGLEWLVDNAALLEALVDHADATTRATIQERLQGIWRSAASPEAKAPAEQLREFWALEPFDAEEAAGESEAQPA